MKRSGISQIKGPDRPRMQSGDRTPYWESAPGVAEAGVRYLPIDRSLVHHQHVDHRGALTSHTDTTFGHLKSAILAEVSWCDSV